MVLVLDGALGTELERRLAGAGSPRGDPLWSGRVLVERPDLVAQVHAEYVQNGADLVTTATYQTLHAGLARSGLTRGQAVAVWDTAVRVAHQAALAAGRAVQVVGSVGPYGSFANDGSEYTGKYAVDTAALVEHHRPLVQFLERNSRVDMIGLETIPNVDEVKALLLLITTKRFFLSLSVANGTLADGTDLRHVLALVEHNPLVIAIGVNCLRFDEVPRYLDRLQGPLPLMVYPNHGYVEDGNGGFVSRPDIEGWTKAAASWKHYGLAIVGGCCGTSPQEIGILRREFLQDRPDSTSHH